MDRERRQRLSRLAAEHKGGPCMGIQLDMWTCTHTKTSYACINIGTVVEPDHVVKQEVKHEEAPNRGQKLPQLRVQSEVLDFNQFPFTSHTANNIKEWLLETLKAHGIALTSISGVTPDGASDGVAAVNSIPELCLKLDTCLLHGLQRAVLYSIGLAGSTPKNPEARATQQNPEAKQLLRKHNRFAQASNQIRAVAYGIREMQKDDGVPASRILATVDTMPTRWGNQYRQVQRNNSLKTTLDAVVGRWKREHNSKPDAIVELDPQDDPNSKVGVPVPAQNLGMSGDEWDMSLEMEAFLEHPFQIKESIEHKGYMTGAQGLIVLADLMKGCANDKPLVVKLHPPTAKLVDRKRKDELRPARLLCPVIAAGRTVLAKELRERFFDGAEVPSDVRLVQLYMTKQMPMEDWAPATWMASAKALYTKYLRDAAATQGAQPKRTVAAEQGRQAACADAGPGLFRNIFQPPPAPATATEADTTPPEDAVSFEIAMWKTIDQTTLQPFIDVDGLLNEMALMYKLRHSFPLHYRVFKQA